ncbi:M50 family metallopeptidase [Bacteroidota bacterium]
MKSESKKSSIIILIAFAVITIVLWQIPGGFWILYPFTILGTWFHEMGHGLAALLLGGNFHRLEIYSNGSGLAMYSGTLLFGNIGRALVAAGGPLGPTIAGATFIAFSPNKTITRFLLYILSFVLIISVILWIRSWVGIGIILVFGLAIIIIATKANDDIKALALQFMGVQACVSVYLSFGYLFSQGASIGGNSYLSDTAIIAQSLFLPYWFWGGLIILLSIFLIFKSLKYVFSN